MNRSEKRFVKFSQRRELRHAAANFDPTRPLVYHAGYRHKGVYCKNWQGGDAERPNNAGAGYYCNACGHTVPAGECERLK